MAFMSVVYEEEVIKRLPGHILQNHTRNSLKAIKTERFKIINEWTMKSEWEVFESGFENKYDLCCRQNRSRVNLVDLNILS